ncbi:MAG: C69 family dipeptidase [Clostridia bacterium]|nr:C69 family dipeptidase [Clostridia bacterium]
MSCTTILAARGATNDGSTMIARTDDGRFDVKKAVVVTPDSQPKVYKSVISHLTVELPENPQRYTSCPRVRHDIGIWAASGINESNVGMTATETITTNPRVLAADPLVKYEKGAGPNGTDKPGGIGEEDIVVIVLPYIKSAREGVLRLGELLEKYGTYESNGIAFNDSEDVWWLETIGGHHWLARRLADGEVAINPNQFGTDYFDFDDALGEGKNFLCSKDLREFVSDNHLYVGDPARFNPRDAFGSRSDSDHIYNTPRAWFMGRYLTPVSHVWEGQFAEFSPESDNIPWSMVPDRKVTVEDFVYLLSSHFQGTPYNPYSSRDTGVRGKYRSIGINRTGVTTICQIRAGLPDEIAAVEWISFGSNSFSTFIPVYANCPRFPKYLSSVTETVSTDNFYWPSRLIGALCDPAYSETFQIDERYKNAVITGGRRIIAEYDRRMTESGDYSLTEKANAEICLMAKKETDSCLSKVLAEASQRMKNGFKMSDN